MQRYITAYSETSYILPNVIHRQLDELLERYDRNWVLLNHIPSDDKLGTIVSLKELRNNYEHYISQLIKHLSLNFNSFDNRFLCSGLIVLFLSCFATITSIYCLNSNQNLINFCWKSLIGLIMGAITAYLIRVIDFSFHENSINDILFLSAVTSIVVSIGSIILPKFFIFYTKSHKILNSREIVQNIYCLESVFVILFVLISFCSFSKTLIKFEETVIHFIFQTLLILFLIDINLIKCLTLRSGQNPKLLCLLSLSLVVLTRLSKELHRCDEEYFCLNSDSKVVLFFSNDFVICSLFLFGFICSIIYYFKRYESCDDSNLSNMFSKYLLILNTLSICGHLCLSLANPLIKEKLLSGNELSLAKTVLYSNAILISLLFVFPLKFDVKKVSNSESVIRLLVSIMFLILSLLNCFLLFKDQISDLSLILFCIYGSIYLLLLNTISYYNSYIPTILWYLMSFNGFFTTGHYKSLESLSQNILFVSQSNDLFSFMIPVIFSY